MPRLPIANVLFCLASQEAFVKPDVKNSHHIRDIQVTLCRSFVFEHICRATPFYRLCQVIDFPLQANAVTLWMHGESKPT